MNKIKNNLVEEKFNINRSFPLYLQDFDVPKFLQKELITAVEEGQSIIVSGPPNSGKTEFLNVLLRYLPASKEIYILEDVKELEIAHAKPVSRTINQFAENADSYFGNLVDYIRAVKPDYIILGEIMRYNSPFLIQLLGNRGSFMTTVNSISCEEALNVYIPFHATDSFVGQMAEEARELLNQVTDWVIYLQKSKQNGGSKRKVVEVWRPKTKYHWKSEDL